MNLKDVFDRTYQQDYKPSINGTEIMAWGGLKIHNGKGINLILLKDPTNIYGKWIQVENKNSGFSRRERIEPFAFELSEIEREIKFFNAMHIYSSEIKDLNINYILENYLISEI